MRLRASLYASLSFAVALAVLATAWPAGAQAPRPVRGVWMSSYGQVYLLRGLIDVFSQGMDVLGEELRRRGIASTVANHSAYDTLAAEAIAKYRAGNRGPIIIAGHSLGANAAMQMAELLNQAKVPVALVVGFGPTLYMKAPANVAHVVNYYQAHGLWHGVYSPGPGFHGSLVNINLDDAPDITHFNIEKIPRLHQQTIARIMALMRSRRPAAAARTRAPAHAAVPAPAQTTD